VPPSFIIRRRAQLWRRTANEGGARARTQPAAQCKRSGPGAVFVLPQGALTYHAKRLDVAAYLPRAHSRLVMRALTIASSDRDNCAFTNPLRTVAQAHR